MMLNCNLKALLLDGNRLGPEWGVRLAEAIARNGSLVQLSLRDNRLVRNESYYYIIIVSSYHQYVGSASGPGSAASVQEGGVPR